MVNVYDLGCALYGVYISVDMHGCRRRLICYVPDNEDRLIILSVVSQYCAHLPHLFICASWLWFSLFEISFMNYVILYGIYI